MGMIEVRANLSEADASALHKVLDRQLEAIQYVERRERQSTPNEFKQEKHAIVQLLQALEDAMRERAAH